MKTVHNDCLIMKYYSADIYNTDCTSYIFETGEPICSEILPNTYPIFSVFTAKVSDLQKKLPFSKVMNRWYSWTHAVCLHECLSEEESLRTGLFLLQRETVQTAFQLLPQHAYSIAFLSGDMRDNQLIEALDSQFSHLLEEPPKLWKVASSINAVLIHCINGWDGYSVNFLRTGDGSLS